MPLIPLLVVSSDLPGSVRPLMNLLLAMEEMTSEWCPYTNRRVLTFLGRHAAVLAGTVQPTPEWDHDPLFNPPARTFPGSAAMAGFPREGDAALDKADEEPLWRLMLHANWRHYCERLPATAAHRFYVEPTEFWMSDSIRDSGMPSRVLFLIRDPRSELAEIWHNGRRTGILPRMLTHVDTPLTLTEREGNRFVRAALDRLLQVERTAERTVLRYEDLVERPGWTWREVREWLALPERPAPEFAPTGHEWPERRWRPVQPDGVDAVFRKRMAAQMNAHGFAL